MTTLTQDEIRALGKVGVLLGGRSAERDVSIMSGTGVLQALQSQGIDAHGFDTGTRSLAELAAEKFDRVFIALHGRYGEDGTLQGALELLGIPYTGSGVMTSAIAMDKITTKILWLKEGIPTPAYAVLQADSDLNAVAAHLGLPLIVKPPHEGSSIGFSKVTALADFQAAYDKCAPLDDSVLAESFVQGREFTVAVLGTGADARALPVVEIVAPEGDYDYQNKYFTDVTQYFCPPQLDQATQAEMQRLAVQAYRTLGCEGWGRVDVLLRAEDNRPFLLEVNTSPGMTSHSLVPMAARAVGMSYEELCVAILRTARLKNARN
ncbi:D-alanine--D-alanine ligase [Pseudoduganella armeniaca]|uniref:D-alanine--D-alanine ligase n=1 Tax=Pseudoduganella armeniaca TaxID=2072590 RepID=A0A2R4C7E8_9BURK|nr:D-alanine--D-alanine ligase [Pseudoduganella armeniaca]AVR95544.1 D-alanine--D-alanine ligase [Pseudoduganella armeniaca]